jgi:predicted transcriptional regulator
MSGDNDDDYPKKGFHTNIVLKILSAINRGFIKKQLETLPGIPSEIMQQYVDELVKDGLVGYDIHDATTLKITEKGSRFLLSYEHVVASKAEHEPPKGLLDLK